MTDSNSAGAAKGPFPETSLTLVRRLAALTAESAPEAWEEFYRRYSRPLLVFAMLERRVPPQDAEDLMQGFFAYLMEAPRLVRFDVALGCFHSWLLLLFKRFHKDRRVADSAEKRGGGWVRVNDVEARVEQYQAAGIESRMAFEREWARESVREAVAACGLKLERRGELEETNWFRARYLDPLGVGEAPVSQAEAMRKLSLGEARAATLELKVRTALRGFIEDQVRADLGAVTKGALEEGVKELLAALGG